MITEPAAEPAAGPTPATGSAARATTLDALDEALVAIRQAQQRPGYRRRLLDGLSRDVDLATLRLLRVVQRADAPPTIGTVADTLAIDPSTASRVVDRAVATGDLERRACTTDRRKARLRLTDAGQAVLDEATAHRRALLAEVTDTWDAGDLDRLVDLLHALSSGFERLETSR